MTPIENLEDIRLVTLLAVIMSLTQELAVHVDKEPDHVLAEELFTSYYYVSSQGTTRILADMQKHCPLLHKAIQ